MKKVDIGDAECAVEMDWYLRGSVLRGTVESGCTEFRSNFSVRSNDDRSSVIEVIELAKKGCYAENMVRTAISVRSEIRLNGDVIPGWSGE